MQAGGGLATENLGQFELDLSLAPDPLTGDPSNAVLLLQNAWAVRSISGGASSLTQVAITTPDTTLSDGAGSNVEMVGAGVDIGGGAAANVSFAPTLDPPQTGDVVLTLDFSNTTAAGVHAGGTYTLTASNI